MAMWANIPAVVDSDLEGFITFGRILIGIRVRDMEFLSNTTETFYGYKNKCQSPKTDSFSKSILSLFQF
jgi:hypothetical protein